MKMELDSDTIAQIEAVNGPTSRHQDVTKQIFLEAPEHMISLLEDEDILRHVQFHCTQCGLLLNPGNMWIEHWHPRKRPGDDIVPDAKAFLAAKCHEVCVKCQHWLEGFHNWREERRRRAALRQKAKANGATCWLFRQPAVNRIMCKPDRQAVLGLVGRLRPAACHPQAQLNEVRVYYPSRQAVPVH
ncbi:hypothetical protein GQ53DRAFT_811225 [Thozetella sp. PMI_491]|nr:hypothetical protein GQ53DRAFT_811225 [Thozetella sp. PMI_491]